MLKALLAIFSFVTSIKWILMIGVLCLGLGGVGTAFVMSKFKDRAVISKLEKNAKQTAKNVEKSRKESDSIEARVAAGNAQAQRVKSAVAQRLTKQRDASNETHPPRVVHPGDRLDVGTVRLLNAARAGTPVGTAPSGDAKSDTPSTVAVDQLIQSDLDAVARYNELMVRHNALVEAVEKKLKAQSGSRQPDPYYLP